MFVLATRISMLLGEKYEAGTVGNKIRVLGAGPLLLSGLRASEATGSVDVVVITGTVFVAFTGNKIIETVARAELVKPSFAMNVKESVTGVEKLVVEM